MGLSEAGAEIFLFNFFQKNAVFVLRESNKGLYLHRIQKQCPGGGIGRRAGLKHQWGNPCRFDPGPGYHLQEQSSVFQEVAFLLGANWGQNNIF